MLPLLLLACQTQRGTLQEREAAPPPEVSLQPLPGQENAAAGEVPGFTLPFSPEDTGSAALSERIVEGLLGQLTLRQKIGQRFIVGIAGTKVTDKLRQLLRESCPGGIMLARQNIASRDQVRQLSSELQAAAREGGAREAVGSVGLFIAVDQEGGRVNRLDLDTLTRFPAPYYWGEYHDPEYVEAVGYITAREALSMGCNLNFAPVLDLYGTPDDSIVGDRAMGSNPVQVGERGVYYLRGARRAGLAAVAKHFPGHGRTTVDSHQALPVVEADERSLLNQDLVPFAMVIADGAEAIMTAHILFPQVDPDYPVTLSERFLRGVLRGRLGFRGVIVSDDIEMGALAKGYSLREILRRCIVAGVDIVLAYGRQDVLKLVEEVEALVASGELTQEQIEEGTRRVLWLKLAHGLIG
jgi:beta-N-acetylhexosaminidase